MAGLPSEPKSPMVGLDRGVLMASSVTPIHCPHCLDTGHVCDHHPVFPWTDLAGPVEGHNCEYAAGIPCSYCCSPIPEDGTVSIAVAFTPDWMRAGVA